MEQESFGIKEVRRWGNSGGVLLPRGWVGKQVKIHLIDRRGEIKKDILKILEPYMEEVIGAYLTGSYSRKEQTEESDIDVLVVSKSLKKKISSGKYEVEIIPLETIILWLKKSPEVIYPHFIDAMPIINKKFLEEIREIKITKKELVPFIKASKKMIKSQRLALELDKKRGYGVLKSTFALYSAVLRLRALFTMKAIIGKEDHSNLAFEEYLMKNLKIDKEQVQKIYFVFRAKAHGKKVKEKIPLKLAEALTNLLEKEVVKW